MVLNQPAEVKIPNICILLQGVRGLRGLPTKAFLLSYSPSAPSLIGEKGGNTLPINKQRKNEIVDQYVDMLERSEGIVITEYRGLGVARFDDIRKKMREVGSSYTVTKNTLLKIALERVGMAVPAELLTGPVAVGFAYENFPGTIKALLDSTKDHELLILKGAIAQADVFDQGQLKTLSELPSMEELRATLAGMVVQPAAQLISLLVAPQRDVVSVVAAYIDKHTEDDSSEDAA